jgi:hypothetical protein
VRDAARRSSTGRRWRARVRRGVHACVRLSAWLCARLERGERKGGGRGWDLASVLTWHARRKNARSRKQRRRGVRGVRVRARTT